MWNFKNNTQDHINEFSKVEDIRLVYGNALYPKINNLKRKLK